MYITAPTLDDLMIRVFKRLLKSKNRVKPTRGSMLEETGILLKLTNPRARISKTETKGTIFSCLGDTIWMLSKSNRLDAIEGYIPAYKDESKDKKTVYGAYGPRIFGTHGWKINQFRNILNTLRSGPDSRRAVIQIYDALDINTSPERDKRHPEIPCTCTLQFMVRGRKIQKLHMITTMRSNDAFLGLPHDIFAFTMLQEIIARHLDIEIGSYKHFAASLHIYDKNYKAAQKYIDEGWQESIAMPAMPFGDPSEAIRELITAESKIRVGKKININALKIDEYWKDLIRLLQIYWLPKQGSRTDISKIKAQMKSSVFNSYIQKRQKLKERNENTSIQLALPLTESTNNARSPSK